MSTQQPGKATVYTIALFSFEGEKTAARIVSEMMEEQKFSGYRIVAEAVVEQNAAGKLHIHEPGRGGVGGSIGAVAGGIVGLFIGPVAVLALAITGGAAGGIAGHFAGRSIPTEDLKKLGEALHPNSSAFVVLIEDTEAEAVIGAMQGYNANVVTVAVGDELSGEIEAAVVADFEPIGTAAANDQPAASTTTPQETPSAESSKTPTATPAAQAEGVGQ
jgi:uncharacterized membrane protein